LKDLKEVCQLADELSVIKKRLDALDGITEIETLFE
jgi:hypothetical protein